MLILVVAIVIVVIGDLVARTAAQDQLANRAQKATDAQAASATIYSFPFLFRLLVEGSVSQIDLHLSDVPVGPLRLSAVDLVAHGTTIDRAALFSQHKIRVLTIDSAKATVVVTAAELSSAVGMPMALPGGGRIEMEVSGIFVPASVQFLNGDVLQVRAAGALVLSEDLSQSPLVPPCALALTVREDKITASCRIQPVPSSVLAAFSGAG